MAQDGLREGNEDQIIELRPSGIRSDVIETGDSRLRLASLGASIRRRPLAVALSIVAAGALVAAATQLGQQAERSSKPGASSPPDATHIPSALASSPTASARAAPGPSISTLSPVLWPPVDVVVAREFRTTDGSRFDLSYAGPFPVVVASSGGGWLVHGSSSLWYLDRSGAARPLLWQIEYAVTGRHGLVAWKRGKAVGAARLKDGVLVDRREVDAKGFLPHVVMDAAVVMVLPGQGGDGRPWMAYDLWRPYLGDFDPKPRESTGAPFGLNFAGTALLGVEQASDGRGCLVEVNPETFAVTRRGCVLSSSAIAGYPAMSPDGRWLLLSLDVGSLDIVSVRIDLNTVFSTPAPAEDVPGMGANGIVRPAWLDATTFVAASEGSLRKFDINNPRLVVEIPLAELPHDEFGQNPALVMPIEA